VQEKKNRYYDGNDLLNIAWIGRCIAGKAMHFLLKGIAGLPNTGQMHLHLVRDGPYLSRWRHAAEQLQVAHCCTWYGWVSYKRANEILRDCDLLAFTSVLDATSATVMSALANGVPVMCLQHCGMGDIINEKNGFPVSIEKPSEIVSRMTEILNGLLQQPRLLQHRSEEAIRSASYYTWQRIAETIRDTYLESIASMHSEAEAVSSPILSQVCL